MDVPRSTQPLGVGWLMVCGTIVAGAALKEIGSRVVESPVVAAAKRPSLMATLLVAVLLKEAVGQLGRGALGVPADG